MFRIFFLTAVAMAVVVASLATTAGVCQQPETKKKPTPTATKKYKRLVFPIRHRDPKQIANTMAWFLNHDLDADLQPVPNSNLLLIRVEEAGFKDALALLEKLDAPPRLIDVQIWIGELKLPKGSGKDNFVKLDKKAWSGPTADVRTQLMQWRRAKNITNLWRFQFRTLENQTAQAQRAADKPMTTSITSSRFGRGGGGSVNRSIVYRSVGTLVRVTPRAAAKGDILLSLLVEDSKLITPKNGTKLGTDNNGAPIYAAESIAGKLNTNLRVASGNAVLARDIQSRGQSGEVRQMIVIVAAEVVPTK